MGPKLLILWLMILCICFTTFCSHVSYSQERYYDYQPNIYENRIKTFIENAKSAAGGKIDYIPRLALAIQFAADTLGDPFDSLFEQVLAQAGGFHRIFDINEESGVLSDSTLADSIVDLMPDSGSYSFKVVNNKGRRKLALYYTDIYRTTDPGGWLVANGPPTEGLPDNHGFGISGQTNADSVRVLRYGGEFMIAIPKDSILHQKTIPTVGHKYEISYTFEKRRHDIVSVNIYGYNVNRQQYDLIAIFCPSNIGNPVNRPQ